jgi:hypothetical protein
MSAGLIGSAKAGVARNSAAIPIKRVFFIVVPHPVVGADLASPKDQDFDSSALCFDRFHG